MQGWVVVAVLFAAQGEEVDARIDAARAVREILALRCDECHGAQLAKPKGRFGNVTDLVALAADPDHVVPGDPDDSELYLLMIEKDPEFRMPPEGAAFGPMSPLEIATIREWIADGAQSPSEADAASTEAGSSDDSDAGTPGAAADPPVPPRALTSRDRLLKQAGRFHPLLVHFPLGLLLSAFVAELLFVIFRSGRLDAAVQFCVAFGGLTAVFAALVGWFAGEYEGYSGAVLTWHRWLGVATAVLALATAFTYPRAGRTKPAGSRLRFRICLLLTALTLSAAGHLGATLVHGPDFLPIPLPLPG